jgi:threonine/homoserine/homoserine lactone efflux protein
MDATFLPPAALVSLCGLVLVNNITPGPNNILLAAAGANFGVRATLPQMAGVAVGLAAVTAATGLGLGALYTAYPQVSGVLKIAGILYILYLAWRIATAGSLGGGDIPHPMTFSQTLALQAANAKMWVAAITTASVYVRPGHALADTAVLVTVFSLTNLPTMFVWAGGGSVLRRALKEPARVRLFNIVMGLALAASVLPLLRG